MLKPKPHPTRLIVFIILCTILGGIWAILWFPNTAGDHGTFWEKVTSAITLWIMSSFLMGIFLQFLIWLFLSRKQIFDLLRTPYSWSVALFVVVLSTVPWLIQAGTNWSASGFGPLAGYAMLCLVPILIVGLVAAAKLSPHLNFSVAVRLLIGSSFTWFAGIMFLHVFAAVFFEPYVFTYPSRDELIGYSIFFWMVFLAIWYLWSKGIRLSERLPSQIRQFITRVNTFRPDLNFIVISIYIAMSFPLLVMTIETYYDQVVSGFGVWMNFTELDKAAWRYSVGAIPLIVGIALLTFLCVATIKLIAQPTTAKNVATNPVLSGLIAVSWIFLLWWIFFSSIATHLNFLSPGQYVLVNNNIQAPTFYDLFFYVFGAITTSDLGDVRAVGDFARLLNVWITLAGFVLLGLLIEIIGATFSKNLFSSSDQSEQQG